MLTYRRGLKDGLPIMFGYLTVAFTFGVACVAKGFAWWLPFLCSLTNFTGTGQFVGMDLIYAGASFAELVATMFIINIRYALMSVTLSQRLSPDTRLWQRFVIAFGNTDENFAVAIRTGEHVTFSYFMGIFTVSFSGWVSGTLIGALAGNVLPSSLLSAFGIAIHAMFIAIILPPCRGSRAITAVVAIAVALSCLFAYTPYLKNLSSGWTVVICGIVAAAIGALLFPIKDDKDDSPSDATPRKGRKNPEKTNLVPKNQTASDKAEEESAPAGASVQTNADRCISHSLHEQVSELGEVREGL